MLCMLYGMCGSGKNENLRFSFCDDTGNYIISIYDDWLYVIIFASYRPNQNLLHFYLLRNSQ